MSEALNWQAFLILAICCSFRTGARFLGFAVNLLIFGIILCLINGAKRRLNAVYLSV